MDRCQQCGTCCRKGGPAFHLEDREILEKGHILLKHLFTIRKGEPVFDNVRGCFIASPSDIIRIRGTEGSPVCVFFNPHTNECTIYPYRPLECRLLKCWDTREIEHAYDKQRLSRKDLLNDIPRVMDLVEYHEERCGYGKLKSLIQQADQEKNKSAPDKIDQMAAFDKHFRLLVVENSLCKQEILDFLFGLPLKQTLPRIMKFYGSFQENRPGPTIF